MQVKMDISPRTKLNQSLMFGYKSLGGSASSSKYFTCDLNKNNDANHSQPVKRQVSVSPDLSDQRLCDLKKGEVVTSSKNSVFIVTILFITAVTAALILQLYQGGSLVPAEGMVVSDNELCTALGQRVLHDGGSSVDAAITAALCLGVVHPHMSGVGGGGMMLVHNIGKNKTRVINFLGTVPKTHGEEMLQNVSDLEDGLYVGVPGQLKGLYHAHSLYGRLSWKNVTSRAATVARDGFNVSLSLAEAIAKIEGKHLPQRFRSIFFPNGQALLPGSVLGMPSLAAVLEADVSSFYDGNFSQEIEDEVRANGGFLSRDDISNYSVQVEQPVEGLFNDFIIQVPPPPSVAAALIPVLRLLDVLTQNQTLKAASDSSDPEYNSTVSELLSDMLRSRDKGQRIGDFTVQSQQTEQLAGKVGVMGSDDLIVSVASSLNRPFGSRIITQSGVILNSLISNFFWPNKTKLFNNQEQVQPGERPPSSLMPVIVVPSGQKRWIYMALSGSGGQQSLIEIGQVLTSVLSACRLHPELQPNTTFIHAKPLGEEVEFPLQKGHRDDKLNSTVRGVLRNKDTLMAVSLP